MINIVEKKADLSDLEKIWDTVDDKPNKEDFVKIVEPLLEIKLDKRDVEVVQEFVLE